MVDYTRTVFFLGNRADMDPNEGAGNAGAENPGAVTGTYTDATMLLTSVTYSDLSGPNSDGTPNNQIEEDHAYNFSGSLIDSDTQDTVSYDLGSGIVSTQLDNLQLANVTVTLGDGSTQPHTLVLTQMTNGDVFLSELPSAPTALDNLNIQSFTINSLDTTFYSALIIPPDILSSNVVCFARGTLIQTPEGAVAVEMLAAGDQVITRDNGAQTLRWIGSRKLGPLDLHANEKLTPIRIRSNALGENVPSSDLLVSPQHRVLVRSRIAQRMFGADEVLVAAKQLGGIEGIEVAHDLQEVEYFHMLFDRHEIVISNGAETESLYTGPEALKSVGPAARAEIFDLFPELQERDYTPSSARLLANGRLGRKLAQRHAQNNKMLVS